MKAFPKTEVADYYVIPAPTGIQRRTITVELLKKGYKLIDGYNLDDYEKSPWTAILVHNKRGAIDMCYLDYLRTGVKAVVSVDQVPPFSLT